ncbi:oxygen-independent coproporphyrinogen III oxidase [Sneathiella sp. P13V-1]|uniref:oxygen-independent coproporphyrinogen III oxidase n=1 Tax=Sneathiella sp. P13V-1 TaxID=2697366 RepID=UPI00187BAC3C|nr:oxygen-independent coproporphyrinogen III oxidase [Sneathiella sp. P13V-1]MBE7636662.1 oxygen-independent coproporphyrinogen III oxidase [Sneathiella sp. P13V-1]
MVTDLAKKYAAPVPRYTSYPTAPHFAPFSDKEIYGHWLNELDPSKPVSLYLHVPFCNQMCWYCGCHTKITKKYQPIAEYADAMRAEIRTVVKALPENMKVGHIHWGGGTPSILSGEDFKSIMELIDAHFEMTPNAERAIEIDPRTVDADKIQALAEAGINRASLGVQDFNLVVQEAINRVQSYEMTAEVVRLLRENGINSINFDLMYGLPLQSVQDVIKTVELSHELRPDRVALFGYAHVPWMKTHMKMINDEDLPGTEQRVAQAMGASNRLNELGYEQIGLDHFASPDDEMAIALKEQKLHRNFQGYTTDEADTLIGIGASSIGSLPQGYVQNTVPIGDYKKQVLNNGFAVAKGIAVTTDDKMRRDVIERLMCDLTVDLAELTARHHQSADTFDEELQRLVSFEQDGLVKLDEKRITVTEDGRYLVRTICAVFDTYLKKGVGKHSRAV